MSKGWIDEASHDTAPTVVFGRPVDVLRHGVQPTGAVLFATLDVPTVRAAAWHGSWEMPAEARPRLGLLTRGCRWLLGR